MKKFIAWLVNQWLLRGARILGTTITIVGGFLGIPGLIAEPHVKYIAAVNVVLGALTVYKGYVNSKVLQAEARRALSP